MTGDLERYRWDLDRVLKGWGITRIVDTDRIMDWLKENDIDNGSFRNSVNLLAGLIPEEAMKNKKKIGEMLQSLLGLYIEVNRDHFNGHFPNRDKVLNKTVKSFPSSDYLREYNKAIAHLVDEELDESVFWFDRTFKTLVQDSTTDSQPYTLFLDAANSYFLAGRSELGKACLKYSVSLNPNFRSAAEILELIRNGEMDDVMRMGRQVEYLQSIINDDEGIDRSEIKRIPSNILMAGLSSIGLDPGIDEIKAMMKRHNSAEELAEVEFPGLREPDLSIAFLTMLGLWEELNPDHPCIEMLEDQVYYTNMIIEEETDEEILEEIEVLEKMLFPYKEGMIREWSTKEDFEDTDMDLVMDILVYMDGIDYLRERGLEIAELFRKEIDDPLWEIPVAFLKEKDSETTLANLEEIIFSDMVDRIDQFYIHQFIENRAWFLDDDEDDEDYDGEDLGDEEDDDEDLEDEDDDEEDEVLEYGDYPVDYSRLADDFVETLLDNFNEEIEEDLDDPPSVDVLFHPASVYYRFLKGMGLDFTTDEPVVDITRRLLEPEVTRKIGRNEPCPCGSGFKYKKCCMKKNGR